MPSPGTTSELYTDSSQSGSAEVLGAPPSSPSPILPPAPVTVTNPVVTKSRMADEGPDGKIRDTSTDALRSGNDLGFRNLDTEEKTAAPAEEKPAEAAPTAPPVAPAPEKLYAGKFKSTEELEKSYQELQSAFTRKSQEKAELEKKIVAAPPIEQPKTPAQIVMEQEEKDRFLADFVANPQKVIQDYQSKAAMQTQIALTTQQLTNEWQKANPDLTDYEYFVSAEVHRLTQQNPELGRDPKSLLNQATANFRQITGKLRSEGAKEALATETRVVPLLQTSAPSTASEQPSPKAPLNFDDAFAQHMKMLKNEENRSKRGLRR